MDLDRPFRLTQSAYSNGIRVGKDYSGIIKENSFIFKDNLHLVPSKVIGKFKEENNTLIVELYYPKTLLLHAILYVFFFVYICLRIGITDSNNLGIPILLGTILYIYLYKKSLKFIIQKIRLITKRKKKKKR